MLLEGTITVDVVPAEGSMTIVPALCISAAFLVFNASTPSQSTLDSRTSFKVGSASSASALVTLDSPVSPNSVAAASVTFESIG